MRCRRRRALDQMVDWDELALVLQEMNGIQLVLPHLRNLVFRSVQGMTCPICFNAIESQYQLALPLCGHHLCVDCLQVGSITVCPTCRQ